MVIRQLTIAETIISNQALFRLNSMNIKFDLCNIKWPNRFAIILGVFLVISIFFAFAGLHKIYAVGAFSKVTNHLIYHMIIGSLSFGTNGLVRMQMKLNPNQVDAW